MIWVAITLIGIGHFYCGYLFAIWSLPCAIAEGKTKLLSKRVAAGFALVWIAGVILLLAIQGLWLTSAQFPILVGCILASYLFCRGYFASTEPKMPWDQYLNKQFQVSIIICHRHGWDIGSQAAIHKLASEKQLRFDGGDYDLLIQSQTNQESSMANKWFEDPMLPNGEIDYDLACSKRILMLSKVLLGSEHIEGIVAQVADKTDTSNLDIAAMDVLRWLGETIEKHRTPDELYGKGGRCHELFA